MGADFVEGHLNLPALDEPLEDLLRLLFGIGAKQRERVKTAEWVANQNPGNGNWREATVIPDGRAAGVLDLASNGAIPVGNGELDPRGVLGAQDLFKRGQALPNY